jgi:hypothetical protein
VRSSGSGSDFAGGQKRQLADDVNLDGWSESHMEQSNNRNEIVSGVLETIRFDLRTQLTSAFLKHLNWLNSLGQNASRDALTDGYGRLLDTLTGILLQHFPALIDIALHDPTCADPAKWACEFARRALHEVMDRKVVLGDDLAFLDQSISKIVLNRYERQDEGDRYSVTTDFYVEIDNVLGKAVNKARLQLARHSWKEGGSWEPAEPKAIEAATESNARTSARPRCPYTLEDLEEPKDRNRKVFEFYPYLKEAVGDARRIYAEEQKRGRLPSTQEIEERIPLLKQATESEYEIIRNRKLTCRNATIHVIMERTSLDDYQTIRRYVVGPTKRE